jgi:hypothetical protein
LWGKRAFLQGFLEKTVCRTWFPDGQNVVINVVIVVLRRQHFGAEKHATILKYIFDERFRSLYLA